MERDGEARGHVVLVLDMEIAGILNTLAQLAPVNDNGNDA
jgi:hypothetical protein